MQAIILAAGMGKRLKELTKGNTKCMVPVNGITLIERTLRILDQKNLSKIVIVVGYKGQELIDYIATLNVKTPIQYIDNPIYDKTNNIYSLALASGELIREDTLLFESDLIYSEDVVDCLIEDPRETLALVDKFESWMDGTCTVLDEEDCIGEFIPGKYLHFSEKEKYYKTVNIYKFSKHFSETTYVPFLEAYAKAMGNNEYYESVIKLIAMLDTKEIRAKRLTKGVWYEIDDEQDLDIAETLFAENESERYKAISSRYGGYWRYPKLLDFCYLVNPYFPTDKMIDEMQSNFKTLLTQYPSGMKVNSLLVAKNFGLKKEHIVVGNGAAEIIKELMEKHISDSVGVIRPTFEEYPNRKLNGTDETRMEVLDTTPYDFRYDADLIIQYFSQHPVKNLILINPDNPTGNYIKVQDVFRICEWTKEQGMRFILDESFVDFAELDEASGQKTEDLSLLKEDILKQYPNLIVVKSISKSYGVPGLRLGVAASKDEELIAELKKEVAIWNINSFAEFYLQIYEKYKKNYEEALVKIRQARNLFVKELSGIPSVKVYPSQANYVMCELKDCNSTELAEKLLTMDLFIKDLSGKMKNGKQYVRLAVRTEEENRKLVDAIQKVFDSAQL